MVGVIATGSKISEPELARTYGISRGTLREAIGRLEACGLVERKPNIGARIVSLSAERQLEIYHVREALEGMAARLAALNMSDEKIGALHKLCDFHKKQKGASATYFQKEGDLDFHYQIVQGTGNSQLIGLLCNDLYQLVRLYRYQFGMASKRAPLAYQEHEHIISAIEARDPELAELLMRHHIRASRKNVEQQLRQGGRVE